MGGSSGGQVTGYRYFANFLLFIGNPIENLIGINFDKRGWISGRRVPMGDNGQIINIEAPSLYGENEGGVAGTLSLKLGTNSQTSDSVYKKYMESLGLQASAYPYQSYISFSGGYLLQSLASQTEEQLQELADQYNNGIIPGRGFYVGNSGYMKEMLLWPKRIHVRNDGREQWYDLKSEIKNGKNYEAIISHNALPFAGVKKTKYESTFSEYFESTEDFLSDGFTGPTFLLGFAGGNPGFIEETISANFATSGSVGGLWSVTGTVEFYGRDFSFAPDQGFVYFGLENIVRVTETQMTADIVALIDMSLGGFSFACSGRGKDGDTSFGGSVILLTNFVGNTYTQLIESGDINPIHKIREILTDDTAMNKSESSVNNENFRKAADRIWGEGLGISWSITEKSCIDAINELCYHIEAGIRVNRQTGLYEMVLFRDNWFDEDEIHAIPENRIKKDSMQYEITNADEVINQVNVNFYDRANIKNSSFSISESGLIQTLGRVNAETVDFPYFMNMRNAEIVANWKLKILSTGVLKGSFTTGLREARKWNRYDLIRLPWSKRWIGTILVRIMSINLGGPTNNEVSIDFIEVVPSTGMMNTTIVADDVIDKPLPPQACEYEPFELPYYLAVMQLGQRKVDEELAYESNFGLVGVVAEQPQSNSLYAVMMTNNYDEWVRAGSIQYSLTADSDQIISKTSTSFTVKNWKNITNVRVGTLIQCGKEWLTGFVEWMVFQGVDPHTGVVSVKRGALDTQPQDWDLGLKFYFCGTDVAYDATEYVSSEKVLVSALTTTPSGVLEQKGSNLVEMKARAIRPYPPANVKFNGIYFPETLIVTSNIVLNWAHRNRLQQTGGEIIGWYDGDVTVESGVTYAYELISENVVLDSQSNISANTVTILASVLKPNKPHTLKLWSVRDGYKSYQKFEHSFFVEVEAVSLILTASKDKVVGSTVPVANISVNVDESLKANMKFDGSSISGKAPAGSTITIEVNE